MFVSDRIDINENGNLTLSGMDTVELAKKYSDEKVFKMINGVLDKVVNNE